MAKKLSGRRGAFAAAGVKKGDIVAAATVTIPEMVYALYGLNKIGAAPLILDPRTSAAGAMDFIKQTGAKIFIVIDMYYDVLKDALFDSDVEKIVVISADTSLPRTVRLLKQLKMPAPNIEYSERVIPWLRFSESGRGVSTDTVCFGENDLAAVTLTGGTTGAPKGVMLSNDGFNAIAFDFKHCGVSYKRGQRFLNIIPMFSSYGIVSSLHMPLSLGLEVVIIPKFDQDKVGYYVKKYRPEHTLLVPAHYEKLMNSKVKSNAIALKPSFESITPLGAPVVPPVSVTAASSLSPYSASENKCGRGDELHKRNRCEDIYSDRPLL